MKITETIEQIDVKKKEAFLEKIWENQMEKIKENWDKKTIEDFIQQKENLFKFCLQNLEDEYYCESNKTPFIMVVPIAEKLDINKYLRLINREGFFSYIKKETIQSYHQMSPYFITGVEINKNNARNSPKKGVNLEEMLAIAVNFKKNYITCTEAKHKKTGEMPILGKMENRPMLHWSRPEICLECEIPSKKRNFCSI